MKNLVDVSKLMMEENIPLLQEILSKSQKLNRENELLKAKYNHDVKYARIHKRLIEKGDFKKSDIETFNTLKELKKITDKTISNNQGLLDNENFAEKMFSRLIFEQFKINKIPVDNDNVKYFNKIILNEYINEYKGQSVY